MASVITWFHYIRHIPPRRVVGRLVQEFRVRTIAKAYARAGSTDVDSIRPCPEFADAYLALGERFERADEIEVGVFTSRGVTRDFGSLQAIHFSGDIDPAEAQWQHDLNFFSFLLPISKRDPQRALKIGAALCREIERSEVPRPGKRPSFTHSPIALSLRIMALSAVLSRARRSKLDDADTRAVASHLARSVSGLEWTLETYLGYNHLAFGSAALVVGHSILGVSPRKDFKRFLRVVQKSLLADGFWAERSPMYHVHMLFVSRAIAELPGMTSPQETALATIIDRMTTALNVVVHPDGEIALFNDSSIEDAVRPVHVGWQTSPAQSGRTILREAGFSRLWDERFNVVMDAGPMGPDDVIGHGHADFLSIEVSLGVDRIIVDPGLASLTSGHLRDWTRSTHSHNGPRWMALENAEFFGAWRVGRRGTARFESPENESMLAGVARGFNRREWSFRRTVMLREGCMSWEDEWFGDRRDPAATFLFDARWSIEPTDGEHKFVLRHRNGAAVLFSVDDAESCTWESAVYFPTGPTSPVPAHKFSVIPISGSVSYMLNLLVEDAAG